jgi:phosphomannomutase / phosphoglucomutase
MHKPVIFREYDIRGVFNTDYDLEFAYDLGKAYAAFATQHLQKTLSLGTEKLPQVKVTVGHDARVSSPSIAEALVAGLTDCGVDVLTIGLVTSPISYFSTFTLPGVTGALMITGSHNPPEYNGFKISVGQSTIFGASIQELRKIIEQQKSSSTISTSNTSGNSNTSDNSDSASPGIFYTNFFKTPFQKGSVIPYDILPSYIQRYSEEFSKIPNLSQLKVVLDCGNGSAGVIARSLFQSVNINPIVLCEEPDGRFPNHHPDPTVEENMVLLRQEVLKTGAQVGIGFDGDADRIGLIDNKGRFILGDELMVLLSREVLQQNPGAKIVGDVKCSDRLYDDISQKGGYPIMWKTGHSLIKEKIKIEKAPFGGEMSGHIFFNDRNYGYDDALYAALRVCEILALSGQNLDELLSDLPEAFNTPEIRIDTTEEKKTLIVETLKNQFTQERISIYPDLLDINLLDGIRLSFKNGWALARASNTQPVLVLRFESSTPEGLEKIKHHIESIVEPLL